MDVEPETEAPETTTEEAKAPEPLQLDYSEQLKANFAMVEQSVKILRTWHSCLCRDQTPVFSCGP